jgi:hypothetical protein
MPCSVAKEPRKKEAGQRRREKRTEKNKKEGRRKN